MPVLAIPGLGGLVTFPDDVDVSVYLEQGWEIVSTPARKARSSNDDAAAMVELSQGGFSDADEPSQDWKLADLVAYAKDHDIEIEGDARKKADVWKSIQGAAGNS